MKLIGNKEKKLLIDFIRLYYLIITKDYDNITFYEKNLISILEEYSMYVDYKSEWTKRKE